MINKCELTPKEEAGGILSTVDVSSDGTREIANAYVERHSNSAFVLPGQIVSQPEDVMSV